MSPYRVVVTRPAEDAAPLARALADLGVEATLVPLMTVQQRPDAAVDLTAAQAVLLTSANGARALAGLTAKRAILVLAVGDATAAAARAAGFTAVESADGDVTALAELAVRRLDSKAGAVVHVAGGEVAGNLGGTLGRAGFDVRRAVVYEAVPAAVVPPALADVLARRAADAVLFFSPRTARTFVNVVGAGPWGEAVRGMDALCLSPAVAEAAGLLLWRAVRTADRPRQDALVDLVARARAERHEGSDA